MTQVPYFSNAYKPFDVRLESILSLWNLEVRAAAIFVACARGRSESVPYVLYQLSQHPDMSILHTSMHPFFHHNPLFYSKIHGTHTDIPEMGLAVISGLFVCAQQVLKSSCQYPPCLDLHETCCPLLPQELSLIPL